MPSASSTGPLQAVNYRSSPPCSHFWRRLRVLLVALVVCRGVVVLSILPHSFEGWDEYQHVAYVEHMRRTGGEPVAGQTTVAPALLSELAGRFPQPDLRPPGNSLELGRSTSPRSGITRA